MVNKGAIARNLRELDARYNRKSRNPRDPLYYSKLALMELCSWIETTMDKIVMDCAKRYLSDPEHLKRVQEFVIPKNYSFTYENHFRPMLRRVFSQVKVEELEGMFEQAKFEAMKSSLRTLKEQRDREAHTFTAGVTPTVDAPSVINRHFQSVYDGLKDIERCVRRLKI